jgi:hypothetical protein
MPVTSYRSLFPLSLNLLCSRVHPCDVWVYSQGPLFFPYPVWRIQLYCGRNLVDAWLYLPDLKVEKIHLYSFFLANCRRWLKIVTYYEDVRLFLSVDYISVDWKCFLAIFVYPVRVYWITRLLICKKTADQALFFTTQLCLWVFCFLTLNTSKKLMTDRDLLPHRLVIHFEA